MDSCRRTPESFVLFDNIVLHVLILFTLLTCLFIFFISNLTVKSFNDQFVNMVNTYISPEILQQIIEQRTNPQVVQQMLISYLHLDMSQPQNVILLKSLTDYITNLQTANITDLNIFFNLLANNYNNTQDNLRQTINEKLKEQLFIIIGSLGALGLLINYLTPRAGYCGILKHLGLELFIVFACIGGIEYWFFTNVASKFIPVYPSTVVTAFQAKMNGLLNKPVSAPVGANN